MAHRRLGRRHGHALEGVVVVALAALTWIAYREVLGYFFTGRDAISFVAEGRVTQLHDLLAFFARRQFSGSAFPGEFYRPITSLSFALDFALSKLNPFGYHLTDLIIHGLVAWLTYRVGRTMLHLRWGWALAAAALFVVYPTHQGIVPVIARRIDPIATLFMLAALLLFEAGRRPGGRKWALGLSWLTYALALLSKETAVVIPPLILLRMLWPGDPPEKDRRWRGVLLHLIPFVLLTAAYLAVRTLILGGLGGYADKTPLAFDAERLQLLSTRYAYLLFSGLYRHIQDAGVLTSCGVFMLLLVSAVGYLAPGRAPDRAGAYLLGLGAIIGQLVLLLGAQTLTTQHAYTPLVWLTLLLARLGQDAWNLTRDLRTPGLSTIAARTAGGLGLAWAGFIALSAHPFVSSSNWQEVSAGQVQFLSLLEESLDRTPAQTRVAVVNLPFLIPSDPWDRDIAYLSWLGDYALRDWLALRRPDRSWDLALTSNIVRCAPLELRLLEIHPTPGTVQFHLRYGDSVEPACDRAR